MAVQAYKTRVLIDQFDFSGDTKTVNTSIAVKNIEANALQSAAAIAIPGNPGGTFELSGYYNGPAAGTIEKEINDRLGSETDCIVSVVYDTSAVGNPAYCQITSWGQQMKIDMPIEDLLSLSATFQDLTSRGYSVAHATVSATGGQTTCDFTTAGTTGGWAVLHIRAITGTATNATLLVESSAASNMGSPTTHGTFTVSAVGAQSLTFTGAVGRYIRLRCSSLGGATDISVTAIVGVNGVTHGAA